jgi:hypothetical protein
MRPHLPVIEDHVDHSAHISVASDSAVLGVVSTRKTGTFLCLGVLREADTFAHLAHGAGAWHLIDIHVCRSRRTSEDGSRARKDDARLVSGRRRRSPAMPRRSAQPYLLRRFLAAHVENRAEAASSAPT